MSDQGIVLGLVGPVCTGKSSVARILVELGAVSWDADNFVRSLYEITEVIEEVIELLGPDVVNHNGKIVRAAIANRVFGSPEGSELLRRLTQEIIYPRTGAEMERQVEAFRTNAGPDSVLLLDAPTLYESGGAARCDSVLLVSAPSAFRHEWARARGWDAEEVARRDERLISESVKRERADWIIDNDGTLDDLERKVREFWAKLVPGE